MRIAKFGKVIILDEGIVIRDFALDFGSKLPTKANQEALFLEALEGARQRLDAEIDRIRWQKDPRH
jgi:hypothetical protein